MDFDQLDRRLQSRAKHNRRTLRLTFPHQGVAVLARSPAMVGSLLGVTGVAVVLGIGVPWFIAQQRQCAELSSYVGVNIKLFTWAFRVISAIVVVVAMAFYFHARPWVFDKNQRRFWRQGRRHPALGDFGLLPDVAALQLCSQRVEDSEGPGWTAYELSVVMQRPEGLRVPVMCHGNRDGIFSDARRLADFLAVPLLDHTYTLLNDTKPKPIKV